MQIIYPDGTRQPFSRERLKLSITRRGLGEAAADAISAGVETSLNAAGAADVPFGRISALIGDAILSRPTGLGPPVRSRDVATFYDLNAGFTWEELAPVIKTTSLRPTPSIVTLGVPSGRYVGDHLSVSRNIAIAVWRQIRSDGELAGDFDGAQPRRSEHLAYAACVHLGRAESAAADAAFWQIDGRLAAESLARAFVKGKVFSLAWASAGIGNGIAALTELANEAQGGDLLTDTRDGAAKKPKKGKAVVNDAIDQASAIKGSIDGLVKKFADDDEEGKVAELVKGVATALVSGGKAALVAAIISLINALGGDASAEDIDVDVTNGVVTIYFRIRRGCLFIFDWAVSDDYVFIRKNLKTGDFEFKSGEKAKKAEEEREEENKKGKKAETPPKSTEPPEKKPTSGTF